jgi:biopolymer transport protein TolR
MAQVEEKSKTGRTSNVELNLVPFIDLMSVLITFLLITAVWTQISMIQLGSSVYGKKTENQQETPPPPPMADIPLRLDVKDFGYRLVVGTNRFEMPKNAAGLYDTEALLARLIRVKETYPEKTDAVITVDDELEYEQLIKGMDTLNQGGFPSISVSTVGAE